MAKRPPRKEILRASRPLWRHLKEKGTTVYRLSTELRHRGHHVDTSSLTRFITGQYWLDDWYYLYPTISDILDVPLEDLIP